MQISKIIKWLPVVLSVLGALGYSSRDTELIRTGVSVAATLAQNDNIGLEKVNEWLGENVIKATSDTKTEAEPKQEQKQKQKSSRQTYTYNGKIIKIHDGDTMHIIDSDGRKHKIRMAYIDAPEINQAYGTQSRDNLIDAALNKKAKVRVFESDRYHREVAQVSVGTIDLNLMQIRDGAAWHYGSYAKKQQSKTAYTDYSAAQKQAKEKRKGLWKKDNPQAPWQFRRQNHEQQNGNKKQSDKQWFGIW